jgi:Arc/MetJ-type ribon-helix-helix transcriptional regulator
MYHYGKEDTEHVGARLTMKEAERLDALVDAGMFLNRSDAVRSAVRDLISSVHIVQVREVSLEKAKKEILSYLDSHDDAYPSDIADALEIDYDLVWKALRELKKQGEVQSP